ncbi:MAG: adaptor protein MecA [Pseudobutyrivibrio sp.]|nr:adaptor protein MecA [Pseudobutyrivibrio sp.]
MKIERINDNQIKCTLTREDLISRHIKLSELAYGSAKARELFREMMEQASFQYGFEAEDIPLMIEAVPLSSESIVLLVTKVDSPDELDTRFSRFSEGDEDYDEDYDTDDQTPAKPSFNQSSADDILNMFNKFLDSAQKAIAASPEKAAAANLPVDITKMFVFDSLEELMDLSTLLASFYIGKNSLYKSPGDLYYLVVSKSDDTPENYNRLCNILAEYGDQQNCVIGTDQYMSEHYETIVKNTALQTLAKI